MKGMWVLFAAITMGQVFLSAGCNTEKRADNASAAAPSPVSSVDDHSSWWCAPHGVPEEVCSLCSAKAAADCKAKGDWCDEHHRAESQCFLCDPSRAEPFARLYEAKFGTKPPPIQ